MTSTVFWNRKDTLKRKTTSFYDPLAGDKPAKVRITTFIDSDTLRYLKKEARLHGEGYQTLINRVLREYITVRFIN